MNLHNFLYGVYPYIALSVFLLGSWVRFDREQYTWKSDSSQLLSKANMRLGSNLFHIGIIAIFFGHFVGLVEPFQVFMRLGITELEHQWIAIYAGSIFGVICLIGGTMLWFRRMFNVRISATSRGSDKFILSWLMLTLVIGLFTLPVSIGHANQGDASVMVTLEAWVHSIIYLRPDPDLLLGVDTVYKVHLFLGMTVFLIFPFTRMVHVWSAPFGYLGRPYQVVRSKRRL